MGDWWTQNSQSDSGGWYSNTNDWTATNQQQQSEQQYANDNSEAYGGYDGSYNTQYEQKFAGQDFGSSGYGDPAPSTNQQPTGPGYSGGMFMPSETYDDVPFKSGGGGGGTSFDDEPPLLEELGINFDHIRQKTTAVLNPLATPDVSAIQDNDLAGPLVFCLLFGGSLLLGGKVQFGYIYGIGVLGCLCMYGLLNLMSVDGISVACTISVLGYCLLPMALLSLIATTLTLK